MNDVEHSLYEYDPSLYRLVHIGNPGDAEFYSRRCAGATSVLELGCGWGRISRDVASRVEHFVGLDINPSMIDTARRELSAELEQVVTFVVGDMRDFDVDGSFDRIIIPYNSLYNLLTVDDLDACLRRVRQHLSDGGVLIFDGYHIDARTRRAMEEQGGVDRDVIAVFEQGEQTVEVIEFSTYDMPRQRIDATYVYRFHEANGTVDSVECRVPQRFLSPFELEGVLERAGLQLESVTGDFFDMPLELDHAQMVVTATRA